MTTPSSTDQPKQCNEADPDGCVEFHIHPSDQDHAAGERNRNPCEDRQRDRQVSEFEVDQQQVDEDH